MTSALRARPDDADGDERLAYCSTSSDGKVTRANVVGTGKFEGRVAGGTVTLSGPFPAGEPGMFQRCNQQTGTYKLK
jgi:hypothetical protein